MSEKYNEMMASRGYAHLKANGAEWFGSIGELSAHLRGLKERQQDVTMTIQDAALEMHPEGEDGMKWKVDASLKGSDRHDFREKAFSQLCERFGFPVRTLMKCPYPLAVQNFRFFRAIEGGSEMLWRLEDGEIRSVHSDKYVAVDHLEIADRILEGHMKYDINYAGLTENQMHILLVDREKFDGPDGSQLQHCTYIGNSETGDSSFDGFDGFFDRICENRIIWGARVKGGKFKKVHRGEVRRGLDELSKWLRSDKEEQIEIAKERLKKAALDMIGSTDEEIMQYITDHRIPRNLAEHSVKIIRDRWPGASEVSRFMVGSGITKASQNLNADRRMEVDVAAAFAWA